MALPEAGESPIPTCLYATVDGSIGVVASLQYKDFEFFSKIEERMRKVVNGIGGLKVLFSSSFNFFLSFFLILTKIIQHEEWRAFKSERRTAKTCGFIDGDLVEVFFSFLFFSFLFFSFLFFSFLFFVIPVLNFSLLRPFWIFLERIWNK